MSCTRCMRRSTAQRMLRSVLLQQSSLNVPNHQLRHAASLAEQFKMATDSRQRNVKPVFRTPEDNPLKHGVKDEGLHYTMSPQMLQVLQKALPAEFRKQENAYKSPKEDVYSIDLKPLQVKTFGEGCIIVREPVLEVTNYIHNITPDYPVPRIVLYGRRGSGRSMTLAHIMHYCAEDKWVLVHVPWPAHWNFNFKEISPSSHRSGRIDLPVESGEWLLNFRSQNQSLLKDIQIQSSYFWTKRESAEEGTPLLDIVEFGLNRAKFASDCVGVVLKELKQQASQKRLKIMVAIDGVNSFWSETNMKTDDKEQIPAHRISLVHNFKKILKNDWTNGVIVCTVDAQANSRSHRDSYTPHYLLGKEGFEWLDPFIPVLVPYYTEKEAYSCIEYFLDMNWIQSDGAKTEEGKKELLFLSNKNPYQLVRLCASR